MLAKFDPDALMEMETTSRLVLEGIQLFWGQLLTQEGWHGLAQSLRPDGGPDIRNHAFYVAVRTMLLGLTDERRRISYPATWQQHLKQALFLRLGHNVDLGSRRWRFRNWVQRKLGRVRLTTEEVQVYQSACPHISAGGNHNPQLCIAYLSRMDQRGYRESDYLVSKARAALELGLEGGLATQHPLERMERLEGVAHTATDMLEAALEAMGREDREPPKDGPCACPHCDNGHGCCCCKED